MVDGGVGHLLALLEAAGALVAKILVSWQELSPATILGSQATIGVNGSTVRTHRR
jgi:hypothetical protein